MKTQKIFMVPVFVIGVVVLLYAARTFSMRGGHRIVNVGPIRIGAIYTLSGESADIGKALQDGTDIALGDINARGGIRGQALEVIYEDAPSQSGKAAVNAAQKLIGIDKVTAMLDLPYSGLGSVRLIAEQHRVPVVDVIDASEEIATFGDWVFGAGVYADGVGREVAKFAKHDLDVGRVAMLVGKDEYLEAVSRGFDQGFVELGGQVVMREWFLVGEMDFRTQLAKIKNTGAQAIFVSHFGEGGLVIKQARELGFDGYFLGSDTFSLAPVVRAAGPLVNDKTYFALWRNFDALTENQQRFAEAYKQKYNKDPGDYLFYNVLGYDGLMVLAEAMQKSDLSPEGIKLALYGIKNFDGLSGPITIDADGINRDPKSAMVTYRNEKIVRVEKQ